MKSLVSIPVRDAASRYLREHGGGSPLYPAGSLSNQAAMEKRARRLDGWAGDRTALAAWLAEQNSSDRLGTSYPLTAAQRENLVAAAQPGSLFVLTGQQPGLLGGPALAVHKALTAVAHARAAAARLGRPVIPIFWAAGDDSDLAESNAAEFLEASDPGLAAAASAASLHFEDPEAAIPMSLRVPSVAEVTRLLESLPATWSAEVRDLARAAYVPGHSLTHGFIRLMHSLLGEQGLLFVDGFSAARRAQGVLARVACATPEFHDALARGTRRLADALAQPPQVPVRPGTVPVFLFENGRRERLYASDSGRVYTAGAESRDLRGDLTSANLENREAPVLLHSALTRPLVVEELFPTLGHVLGPAELRYFAQIVDVFPAFGFSFPLLAPREQALVVPSAGLAALEDLGFRAEDLFDLRPSLVRERLTDRAWKIHPAAQAFPEEAQHAFQSAMKDYQSRWFPGTDFEAAHRRFGRAFGHYREQARKRVFEQTGREAFDALQPLLRWLGNGTQDRHLNVLSLRNVLGVAGFAELVGALAEAGDSAGSMHAFSLNAVVGEESP